jgi:hypothetical protein
MDNSEKLTALGTQDTGRRQTKQENIALKTKKMLHHTLLIEVPVPSQKSEQSYISVIGAFILPLFIII